MWVASYICTSCSHKMAAWAAFPHLFLFCFFISPCFLCKWEPEWKHKLMCNGGSATCACRPNGLCRVSSPLRMRHADFKMPFHIFHVRICLIAYLSIVPFILSLRGQFRRWHNAAPGCSGSDWRQEMHIWRNWTSISKNPVSKLHTACSCLPTWPVCDRFIPKDTIRTQEAEGMTERFWTNHPRQHFWISLFSFDCFFFCFFSSVCIEQLIHTLHVNWNSGLN